MNERDELAAVIVAAYGEDAEVECPCEQDLEVADAILAAGYSKPRQVSTVEELDALPALSVVLDKFGESLQKMETDQGAGTKLWCSGDIILSDALPLPATVLYEGGSL